MALASFLDGLGGTGVNGSFYKAPPNIDLEKKPGQTRICLDEWSFTKQFKEYLTASYFVYSPNLVWCFLAAVLWMVFPYDTRGTTPWEQIIWNRTIINVVTVIVYYGYWHLSIEAWCSRPFSEKQRPLFDKKVIHNMFYTTLGAIQWSLTEVAFVYGYASGRLSQEENVNVVTLITWILLVPIIRDFHFYFAHRFLHIRFVYKYIHSVHHRNTDTEPFSGMCMHPAEHLYYFTCHGPLLWAGTRGMAIHPFLVTWMGVHVMLSPAASHSGYEDHWSADLYHYLHHRYFECNYGASGPFFVLERWLGTFRDRLEPGANEKLSSDPKATLIGIPQEKTYFVLGVLLPSTFLRHCLKHGTGPLDYRVVSLLIASAPLLAAALLHACSCRASSIWKHYMAPFHQETLPVFVVHAAVGGVIGCVLPAYSLCAMLLQNNK